MMALPVLEQITSGDFSHLLVWLGVQVKRHFLIDNKYITNLKLRASFGVTGNQEIGNYKSLAQLNADNYIYNDGELQGYYESIG